MLSIIIPTWQAEATLRATLDACADLPFDHEIIITDAASTDATCIIATQAGANVVQSARGRGIQLVTGAANASGQWLLFLHADTTLTDAWRDDVANFMAAPGNRFRAAAFQFALNDDSADARRTERWVARRIRLLGLPYGDQGLLIHRAFYDGLGGFRPLPLMEDVDLIRRIGRTRLQVLDAHAVTSAAKYRRDGYWGRSLRNLGLLCLYYLGIPPTLLARMYR